MAIKIIAASPLATTGATFGATLTGGGGGSSIGVTSTFDGGGGGGGASGIPSSVGIVAFLAGATTFGVGRGAGGGTGFVTAGIIFLAGVTTG